MRRPVLVLTAALAALLLVVVGLVGFRLVRDRLDRSPLQEALARVPSGTLRTSFTDWAAVRAAVRVPTTADPSLSDVRHLADRSYDRDLSSASSLTESALPLVRRFGFSPATAAWEAFSQSRAGAAVVLRLEPGTSFARIASRLSSLGYRRPSSATGVWRGGVDLVASIDAALTPELQHVVLLEDEGLVVSSDTASYAAVAARAASGRGDNLAGVAGMPEVASALGDTAAAVLWTGDFACQDLAMSGADEGGQAQADTLVAKAGGVTPLTGLGMGISPTRRLTVAEQFASDDQASRNLRPRAELAVGEAVGRGGAFPDTVQLRSSVAEGSTVVLDFTPATPSGAVLSALYSGPVLLATC